MVLDTSAVMAILQQEPEADAFARRIEAAERCLVSAVSVLEAGILAESRRGPEGARDLDGFLQRIGAEVVPFAMPSRRIRRVSPSAPTARGAIRPASTSATAPPTRWRRPLASRCCSRATTSRERTSPRPSGRTRARADASRRLLGGKGVRGGALARHVSRGPRSVRGAGPPGGGPAEGGPPPLGFHLFLGPAFREMAQNMVRNPNEGRVLPTEVVCRRP